MYTRIQLLCFTALLAASLLPGCGDDKSDDGVTVFGTVTEEYTEEGTENDAMNGLAAWPVGSFRGLADRRLGLTFC